MARIELQEVAHSYHPNPQGPEDYIFKRIHTTWDDGGAYALLGPSGCGKTTMLNLISGLLTPSKGKILYDGRDVTTLPPEQRNIAQVFQFPVLYDTMTVYDNLAFPLRNRGVPESEVKARVGKVSEILGLSGFLGKRAAGLAADAKQKISLGRGLVRSDVAAILFDEPLTVIDPHLKWQLRRSLKEIHKEFKLTLIYVTHDQVEAMTFADKVVIMYEGEMVQTGSPEELFETPEHSFVGYFIGSPGMNFLEGELEGDSFRFNGSNLPVDPEMAAKARAMGGDVKLGVRPMYVKVAEQETTGAVQGKVAHVEDQGHCRIVSVELGQFSIKARIKDDSRIPEGSCWISIPIDKAKLFADDRLVK